MAIYSLSVSHLIEVGGTLIRAMSNLFGGDQVDPDSFFFRFESEATIFFIAVTFTSFMFESHFS